MDEMVKNHLSHHGILGQKWGVRRYQNYDGTYTKKGLKRYRDAKEHYENTKQQQKDGKASRGELKVAKRQMNKAYEKLKKDKMADQGRELYSKGRTITSNTNLFSISETAIAAGSVVAHRILSTYGDKRVADISAATIGLGGTIVNGILSAKTSYENKRLRAYYSHHS